MRAILAFLFGFGFTGMMIDACIQPHTQILKAVDIASFITGFIGLLAMHFIRRRGG